MIYLELDYKRSIQKLRSYTEEYNAALLVSNLAGAKKLSLKSTHLGTAVVILQCYGAYLLDRKIKRTNEPNRFFITNSGLGTKKFQHRATIYRHLLILERSGIIKRKIFHGSDHALEIELNPEILIPRKIVDTYMIDELKKIRMINPSFNEEVFLKKHLCFKQNPSGVVASCHDYGNTSLLNINMSTQGVDESKKLYKSFSFKKGKSENEKTAFSSIFECLGSPFEFKKNESGNFKFSGDDPELKTSIGLYAKAAWSFARSTLYKDQTFSEHQTKLTLDRISEYFSLISHSLFTSTVDKRFREFSERILLARKYLDKSPERFIPMPWKYFDKNFPHGFRGTLDWLEKTNEQRKKNKYYHLRLKKLSELWKEYIKNPTLGSFKNTESKIRELKDGALMEIFYRCVCSPEKILSQKVAQIYYKRLFAKRF